MSLVQVKKVIRKVRRFGPVPVETVEAREEALWKSPLEEWEPQK
ncbi:MAG: hypothetical protein ABSF36_05150 [Candidatus Methanomethylicaceae archaeon]|jgi:hypothetical protein